LRGNNTEPETALEILLYSYCRTFSVTPEEAQNTPIRTINKLMSIHGAVKEIEAEEIDKAKNRRG